jgi:hypothetical protein
MAERRRLVMVGIRATQAQRDRWKRAARRGGHTFSQWARFVLEREARADDQTEASVYPWMKGKAP